MGPLPLGHWLQFSWHAAALGMITVAVGMGGVMLRSLARDELSLRARKLRWEVLGWSAVMVSALSVCVWPYLTAFSQIRVDAEGGWRLENYLGIAVAELSPRELRTLLGEDLGGLHVGMGRVYVRRADGRLVRSVRTTAHRFTVTCKLMGYAGADVTDAGGSLSIPAHRFTPRGPAMTNALALSSP